MQTSPEELTILRSQIATLKGGRGQHRKYLPYAFTEHGAIMAANILNSPRAVEMSVYVVREGLVLPGATLTVTQPEARQDESVYGRALCAGGKAP